VPLTSVAYSLSAVCSSHFTSGNFLLSTTIKVIEYLKDWTENCLKNFYNIMIYRARRKRSWSHKIIYFCVSCKSHHIRPFSDTRSLTFPVRDLSHDVFAYYATVSRSFQNVFFWRILGDFQKKLPRRSLDENDWSVVCPNEFFIVPSPFAKRLCDEVIGRTRRHGNSVSQLPNSK